RWMCSIPEAANQVVARIQKATAVSLRSTSCISERTSREWSSMAWRGNAVPGWGLSWMAVARARPWTLFPPSSGDAAEFLHSDVDQVSGCDVFVTVGTGLGTSRTLVTGSVNTGRGTP